MAQQVMIRALFYIFCAMSSAVLADERVWSAETPFSLHTAVAGDSTLAPVTGVPYAATSELILALGTNETEDVIGFVMSASNGNILRNLTLPSGSTVNSLMPLGLESPTILLSQIKAQGLFTLLRAKESPGQVERVAAQNLYVHPGVVTPPVVTMRSGASSPEDDILVRFQETADGYNLSSVPPGKRIWSHETGFSRNPKVTGNGAYLLLPNENRFLAMRWDGIEMFSFDAGDGGLQLYVDGLFTSVERASSGMGVVNVPAFGTKNPNTTLSFIPFLKYGSAEAIWTVTLPQEDNLQSLGAVITGTDIIFVVSVAKDHAKPLISAYSVREKGALLWSAVPPWTCSDHCFEYGHYSKYAQCQPLVQYREDDHTNSILFQFSSYFWVLDKEASLTRPVTISLQFVPVTSSRTVPTHPSADSSEFLVPNLRGFSRIAYPTGKVLFSSLKYPSSVATSSSSFEWNEEEERLVGQEKEVSDDEKLSSLFLEPIDGEEIIDSIPINSTHYVIFLTDAVQLWKRN